MTEPVTDATPPRMKVLIVDDEEGIRSVLTRLLGRLPHPPPVEIETAESAEQAIELLERNKYTLILTDFNMGGRDGVFLLATARERWPDTLRMLMTGYTDEEIMVQARERGKAAAIVRKPWDNTRLLATVSGLLAEGERPA